MISLKQF